ncbi:MAG: glutamate--tRNA ligase [Bacteroidota bacterium]|nr:glutamate--tRNA ligase [Bacteroidota bacterium]
MLASIGSAADPGGPPPVVRHTSSADMEHNTIRVRFAPSPTGLLHIGGLRTALFCYLFARGQGGTVVLRIEDTDRSRFVPEAEADIAAALAWIGLSVDEGPTVGGPFGPYRQSERKALYHRHVKRLIAQGDAYYAFDTPAQLTELRSAGAAYNVATRMDMTNSLTLPADEVSGRIADGQAHTVRLRVPADRTIRFEDMVKGSVTVESSGIDDQVLIKSDGMPTYHLANVVDDHLMQITHVIRGDEWLPSVAKHILLYEALGWHCPAMAHLPLILSPNGGKLSKRSAQRLGLPVNVRDYQSAGYEPEAVVNFLAFLGWNPGTRQEVFSLAELEKTFTLERVGSAPARFDLDKLQWFNAQHLRRLSAQELWDRACPYLVEVAPDHGVAAAALVQDRIILARDLAETYPYLFTPPDDYDPRGVRRRWKQDSPALVEAYAERLSQLASWEESALETALRSLAAEHKVGAGCLIHPARLAVSGTTAGPSLFALLRVLGQTEVVERLHRAVAVL